MIFLWWPLLALLIIIVDQPLSSFISVLTMTRRVILSIVLVNCVHVEPRFMRCKEVKVVTNASSPPRDFISLSPPPLHGYVSSYQFWISLFTPHPFDSNATTCNPSCLDDQLSCDELALDALFDPTVLDLYAHITDYEEDMGNLTNGIQIFLSLCRQ